MLRNLVLYKSPSGIFILFYACIIKKMKLYVIVELYVNLLLYFMYIVQIVNIVICKANIIFCTFYFFSHILLLRLYIAIYIEKLDICFHYKCFNHIMLMLYAQWHFFLLLIVYFLLCKYTLVIRTFSCLCCKKNYLNYSLLIKNVMHLHIILLLFR